ncbi:6-phospho-3-hexuloisomerase [Plantibacter sp. CFBP 8804]|uniref:6-phospho-3-hexuloisomerase n=1 Tax=Plantibacter sp. CFBP 8804 TaxID=2775270 RepID=UPI00177BBA01|nr:6-phospho-3-hexuloisomerase [Plantibacter sp. CFBP 8804]MBD8517984.1 6-phospho-3-hexuloisomerase [Plantibacter sp. CFBP 8804]
MSNPTASVPPSTSTTPATSTVQGALTAIDAELHRTVSSLLEADPAPFAGALDHLRTADRVFVSGAGRSGLALRMTAMRLMHLGLTVHVVGETTTPAITSGDVLLVASGSGTTTGVVRAADTAVSVGAQVIAITTDPGSPLAELAAETIVVPAAQKTDHGGTRSVQYSGSLFEQAVMLLGDAFFHALWQSADVSAEELWPRHANLE